MQFRKMLLSLATATGIAGAAHAAPPCAVPEGREPNPVAREFYLPDAVPLGSAASVPSSGAPATGDWLGIGRLWEKFADEFSMPLGTTPMIVPVWD